MDFFFSQAMLLQVAHFDDFNNLTFHHSDSYKITPALSQLKISVTGQNKMAAYNYRVHSFLLFPCLKRSLQHNCILPYCEHRLSLIEGSKDGNVKHKFLVVLLLLLSGNVETNPGPDFSIQCLHLQIINVKRTLLAVSLWQHCVSWSHIYCKPHFPPFVCLLCYGSAPQYDFATLQPPSFCQMQIQGFIFSLMHSNCAAPHDLG